MVHIKLDPSIVKPLHEANPMMMSYNVEFTEVTGGTFWKEFTPGQIAGTEPFQLDLSSGDFMEIQKGMMQYRGIPSLLRRSMLKADLHCCEQRYDVHYAGIGTFGHEVRRRSCP